MHNYSRYTAQPLHRRLHNLYFIYYLCAFLERSNSWISLVNVKQPYSSFTMPSKWCHISACSECFVFNVCPI